MIKSSDLSSIFLDFLTPPTKELSKSNKEHLLHKGLYSLLTYVELPPDRAILQKEIFFSYRPQITNATSGLVNCLFARLMKSELVG